MLSACEVLSWQKSELLSTSQPSSSCFVVSQSAEMAGKQHRRFPVEWRSCPSVKIWILHGTVIPEGEMLICHQSNAEGKNGRCCSWIRSSYTGRMEVVEGIAQEVHPQNVPLCCPSSGFTHCSVGCVSIALGTGFWRTIQTLKSSLRITAMHLAHHLLPIFIMQSSSQHLLGGFKAESKLEVHNAATYIGQCKVRGVFTASALCTCMGRVNLLPKGYVCLSWSWGYTAHGRWCPDLLGMVPGR